MKELISRIVSAWAWACIFVAFCGAEYSGEHPIGYLICFALAVTGAGWLSYRSSIKNKDEDY